jgi:hypothetical protein
MVEDRYALNALFAFAFKVSRIMTPAGGLAFPVKLTTRATIEPSPDNGCHIKFNSSALEKTPCPDPFTVNTLFA